MPQQLAERGAGQAARRRLAKLSKRRLQMKPAPVTVVVISLQRIGLLQQLLLLLLPPVLLAAPEQQQQQHLLQGMSAPFVGETEGYRAFRIPTLVSPLEATRCCSSLKGVPRLGAPPSRTSAFASVSSPAFTTGDVSIRTS